MISLDYALAKKIFEAEEFLRQYKENYTTYDQAYFTQLGKRTVEVETRGFRAQYSQQEIRIFPRGKSYRAYSLEQADLVYPDGVTPKIITTPHHKEYVAVRQPDGSDLYYLIPAGGLRLQRNGGGTFKVVNPINDYRIEIDRKKAKEAREKYEELIKFIKTLWDLIDEPPMGDRPNTVPSTLPNPDDRTAWHNYLLGCKWARWKRISLDTLIKQIYGNLSAEENAYKVSLVPNTQTDCTDHYYKLEELRVAGALEKFEGKKRKKNGTT